MRRTNIWVEGWGDIINGTLGFLALGLGGLRQSGLKNTLRESVRTDAEGLSELPFKERGPVVARATDLKTGKLSEPYTNVKKMPEDLHPLLEERANELKNMGNEKPPKLVQNKVMLMVFKTAGLADGIKTGS